MFVQHHLHWTASRCGLEDGEEPTWLRTRSSIQIHRQLHGGPMMSRPRVNSAIYISSDRGFAIPSSDGKSTTADFLASVTGQRLSRRTKSADNIPLAARMTSSDDEEGDDADEERRRRRRRRPHMLPVLSISGPSPPGLPEDEDVEVALNSSLTEAQDSVDLDARCPL